MKAAVLLRLLFGAYLFALSAVVMGQNAYTTDSADVYAGPDDSYPVVAQLDPDSPVQVMGCLDDWSWCDVVFEDNRGWVYAPDIDYQYQGGYVPLYTYAPALGVPIVEFTIGTYWDRYYRERPWYSRRDEWLHRPLPEHRRPPGPRPSTAPPPLSARVERPARGNHPPRENGPDRSFRLGSAESRPRQPEESQRRQVERAPPVPPPAPAEQPPRTEQLPPPRMEQPRQEARPARPESERSVRPERRENKPERPADIPH